MTAPPQVVYVFLFKLCEGLATGLWCTVVCGVYVYTLRGGDGIGVQVKALDSRHQAVFRKIPSAITPFERDTLSSLPCRAWAPSWPFKGSCACFLRCQVSQGPWPCNPQFAISGTPESNQLTLQSCSWLAQLPCPAPRQHAAAAGPPTVHCYCLDVHGHAT